MKTSEFYNDYQHFYISGTTTTTSEEYFVYETPPTRMYNWQWSSNPSDFQPENGVYQCTRAANFSSLYEIPIKKNPLRSKVSNLLQGVLLRGQRNRIYHKELRQVTPTKLYCQSTELPVD